jgi:hypothetical protein
MECRQCNQRYSRVDFQARVLFKNPKKWIGGSSSDQKRGAGKRRGRRASAILSVSTPQAGNDFQKATSKPTPDGLDASRYSNRPVRM